MLNSTLLTMTRVNISCVSVEGAMQGVLGWLCDVSYDGRCEEIQAEQTYFKNMGVWSLNTRYQLSLGF